MSSLQVRGPDFSVTKQKAIEDAKKMLLRLTSRNRETNFNADETISMMKHTDEMEKSVSEGASYKDCFMRTDLRRTEICCMAWFTQAFCGSSFMDVCHPMLSPRSLKLIHLCRNLHAGMCSHCSNKALQSSPQPFCLPLEQYSKYFVE